MCLNILKLDRHLPSTLMTVLDEKENKKDQEKKNGKNEKEHL